MASKSDKLMVAAIDFGTTYSGYAFSFRSDPKQISTNQSWVSGGQGLVSLKTPTSILFKPDKTFDSFGYEAENKYASLAEERVHTGWRYFRRFKMRLFSPEGVKRSMEIRDDQEQPMEAKTVFSEAIKFLVCHMMKSLDEKKTMAVGPDDIHWVVTVPAIWDDAAKQFMREAAMDAGIKSDQLTLCLEPEVAAVYCKAVTMQRKDTSAGIALTTFDPGAKFMVLDLGGGTVDVTVHEVQPDGSLNELYKASGGAWGGTNVDNAFLQLMMKVIGGDVLHAFSHRCKADRLDLDRDFELKKRSVNTDANGKITFRFPVALGEIFEEKIGEKVADTLLQTHYVGKMEIKGDKLRIDAELFRELFTASIDSIVEHVQDLLSDPKVSPVDNILLVGGFSEAPLIKSAIRTAFPQKKIIMPTEGGLAVLKGAVLYGHAPSTINSRVLKYTYGINAVNKFIHGVHPVEKLRVYDGIERCKEVFGLLTSIGQTVNYGEVIRSSGHAVEKRQTGMLLDFYAASELRPTYVTDPCCMKIGELTIGMPDTTGGRKRRVDYELKFGGTEIEVDAIDETSGERAEATIDFLG